MSFLPISEQNQQAPTGQTTPAPNALGGMPPQGSGGSVGAGTGGGPKVASTGTPTQFGSSASKLGDYLSANAPQIGAQADTVATGLNNQYNTLNQRIQNAATQFGQQVQGGYTAPNQDIVNQALSNPTQFAQDPNNVSAFQAQYNNQYTGPQNFESTSPYAQIQGQVQNAVQQGNLVNTQAGLQSYLGGQNKNPTQASSTLDALLLRGNPQAQEKIRTAANQFGNLTGQLDQAKTAGGQQVEQAKTAANQSKDAAQQAAQEYIQNFSNQINQGAQTAEQQRQSYNQGLNQYREQLTPVEQQINAWLGTLPGNAGAGVADIFAPAINANQTITNPVTAQSYATPEQYQQAAAIQQLLGGSAQLPINQTTANLAGTAQTAGSVSNPTLQELLGQFAPTMKDTMGKAFGPGHAGLVDYTPTMNLVEYLSGLDPAHYYANNTGWGIKP